MYIVKECWRNYWTGFVFKRFSKYKMPFDRMIVRYRENGIAEKIRSDYSKRTKEKLLLNSRKVINSAVLRIRHFEALFYLLMLMLLLAGILFSMELIHNKCFRKKKVLSVKPY